MTERLPIETYLKPPYDEAQIAATWNRINKARPPHAHPAAQRGWWFAGAGLCASIVTLAMLWPSQRRSRPLMSHDPTVNLTPGAILTTSHHVVFDDRSTIALSAGTRMQVLANEGARFATLLEAGRAHFDVQPGGERRWEIETALASVEVVGTAFTVTLRDRRLEVEVERGVVIVNGERVPGRVVRLTAGQRVVVGDAPATELATHAIPVAPDEPPAPVQTRPRVPKSVVVHAPDPEPHATESIAAILARADQLSSTGDPAGAAKLLEGLRASDRWSGLVSFTLGRLYLDALDKPELAAIVFGEVIDRGNPKSLVEDAYARRVEALVRAGLHNRALAALVDYEHAYPNGRRIGALRAMVEGL